MTLRDLEKAGRLDTVDGQAALALARQIDTGNESGSALTSLVRGVREALDLALIGAAPERPAPEGDTAPDPIDLAKERSERRRAAE
ncbi:hypothetical protein ACK8HX_02120 [Oryzobacter sp. R7]|uniref:hypothetical protein n=1 Tax=Oryzobacter faecalis TaxID=3388656 RepID=UPI00398CDEAC